MKKFSHIKNNNGKYTAKSGNIQDILRNIVSMTLNVSVNGSIDEHLSSDIKIDGIDDLTLKLEELLTQKIAENAQFIADKFTYQGINEVNNYIKVLLVESQQGTYQIKKHKERIESLLILSNNDLETTCNRQAKTIKSGEMAYHKSIAAQQLMDEHPEKKKELKKIHDIFLFRSKQLGYKK